MTQNNEAKLDRDELIKSLQSFDFSPEDIEEIVKAADEKGQLITIEDVPEIEKGMDGEEGEKKKEEDEETIDEADMKKAYDDIMKKKEELDKSMESFMDKFGNLPVGGKPTGEPNAVTAKSVEPDIEKGLETIKESDFEKSFGDKFEQIEKSFADQNLMNSKIMEQLGEISKSVEQIAVTPNPLKSLLGDYGNKLINKSADAEGKSVYSLSREKNAILDQLEKSLDSITNERDKQIIRDSISTFNISGYIPEAGKHIVSKALNIDFEK